MIQPVEPKKEDCCNSGCNPCIFDVYEKQMILYKSYIERGGGENDSMTNYSLKNSMSQLEYSSYKLVKSIDLCKQHRLLLFQQDESITDKHVFWNPGEHFFVKFTSVEHSCTRAYTPIRLRSLEEDYEFAIIVKRYENGLVSSYLCDLNVGVHTLWRGPYGQYKADFDRFSRIVMVAQGTGLAPLFSIIQHILNDEDSIIRMILLYCCQCIETILLREELYKFKSYWNFEYVIHLSEKPNYDLFKYKEPISIDRLAIKDVCSFKPFLETDQFILCGSDEFMNYYSTCLQKENVGSKNIISL